MGLDRDMLRQLQLLVRPLAMRIAGTVARGVVQLVNDATKQQLVQLGALVDEDINGAEHFQPYGFSSVPLAGAEAVVLFPNGDRSHPLVIAAADRRHRPTGNDPGVVTVYNSDGAKITMTGVDIEVQPGPGGKVYVRDEGGTAEPVVKKSEFDGHTHSGGTLANGSGTVTGATGGASAVIGTTRSRFQ